MAADPLPVLDLSLRRREAQQYEVELRFNDPASADEDRLISACGPFERAQYQRREFDASETGDYGKLLGRDLLGAPAIQLKLAQWRTRVQQVNEGRALRVRLFIEPSAPELHALRWEALSDPASGEALFHGERVYFSRFLTSTDWRLVRLRARSELRALVAIASPNDLADAAIQLAPVDHQGELDRAHQSLDPIPITALSPGSPTGNATLDNIFDQLRRQEFDILYLVCHGALRDPSGGTDPVLWLEDAKGESAVTDAPTLARELDKLAILPRLVVFASCQSGGSGRTADEMGAMTAMAPRLAEAGIPAVVAMQDNIAMDTVARFMPVFFRELRGDGLVDRAMAVARGKIGGQDDYWAPVLYTRLRDACLWYVPGFGDSAQGFKGWPALVSDAEDGKCVPILGAGMVESIFGPSREITRRFAEDLKFPLASHDRDNLPSVAQYLAISQSPEVVRKKYRKQLTRELRQRYPELVPDADFHALLGAAGAAMRRRSPSEPHQVLASKRFNCPLYITTNPDTLLETALREAGKSPRINYCRWFEEMNREAGEGPPPDLDFPLAADAFRPDSRNPLVFHLFGLWDVPESLVLSEDDYFDYLIGATLNKDLIPGYVRGRLADSPLLFMGFHIDEWSFRVLFRQLKSQQGGNANRAKRHIGAQIGPDQDRIMDVNRARQFFQDYFATNQINLYWGNVEDFTGEFLRAAAQED
ncbi:MAG TPA: CHAT domain-containing protein [Bryobacteraceae bacterium]|nr:CHAT domain-containing protein [Bryobacteraceae bacterium]